MITSINARRAAGPAAAAGRQLAEVRTSFAIQKRLLTCCLVPGRPLVQPGPEPLQPHPECADLNSSPHYITLPALPHCD